jgi:hypothetical protein
MSNEQQRYRDAAEQTAQAQRRIQEQIDHLDRERKKKEEDGGEGEDAV